MTMAANYYNNSANYTNQPGLPSHAHSQGYSPKQTSYSPNQGYPSNKPVNYSPTQSPDYQYALPHQGNSRQGPQAPHGYPMHNGQGGSPRGSGAPPVRGYREGDVGGQSPRGSMTPPHGRNFRDTNRDIPNPGLPPRGMPVVAKHPQDTLESSNNHGSRVSPRGMNAQNMHPISNAPHSRHHRGTSDFDTRRSECLRRGVLYEDPDFLAQDTSIYYSRNVPFAMEWRRPKVCFNFSCHYVFVFNKNFAIEVFTNCSYLTYAVGGQHILGMQIKQLITKFKLHS